MSENTIVVLGGAAAGSKAAITARMVDPTAKIVIIERNKEPAIQPSGVACCLSGEADPEGLADTYFDFVAEQQGIELMRETECVGINPTDRKLKVRRNGADEQVPYKSLIFALGASSVLPSTLPHDAVNLVTFRTLRDFGLIEAALGQGASRIVILGGGPFGLEAADALVRRGIKPTIIEKGKHLLPQFSPEISDGVAKVLRNQAAILTEREAREATKERGGITALTLNTGESLPCDLIISAIGLHPRTELMAEAGAKLTPQTGALIVDKACATSLPGVFGCGVCIAIPQVFTTGSAWFAQAAIAERSAEVAGINAAGGKITLPDMTGSMLLRVGSSVVGRTGMPRGELEKEIASGSAAYVVIDAVPREAFMPNSDPLKLALYWSRKDKKVLAVEAVGADGVDKRIDAAASAIRGNATLESLALLDFGYAPAFNTTSDPLNIAALTAWAESNGYKYGSMARAGSSR